MPALTKGEDTADSTSAFFKNKSELCARTNTKQDDWDPMVQAIRKWWEALPSDSQDFTNAKGKNAKSAFSKDLAKQLFDHYPERVEEMDEGTVINLTDALIGFEKKQIAKRRLKIGDPNTMSQGDDQSYTRSQSVASIPAKRSAAADTTTFEDEDVRVRYDGGMYSISLSDIGRACTPPLDAKNVSTQIGLANFMAPFSEEIGLSGVRVGLYYRHSMAEVATLLRTDRSIRPALRDYLKHLDGLFFEMQVLDDSEPQTIPTTMARVAADTTVNKDSVDIDAVTRGPSQGQMVNREEIVKPEHNTIGQPPIDENTDSDSSDEPLMKKQRTNTLDKDSAATYNRVPQWRPINLPANANIGATAKAAKSLNVVKSDDEGTSLVNLTRKPLSPLTSDFGKSHAIKGETIPNTEPKVEGHATVDLTADSQSDSQSDSQLDSDTSNMPPAIEDNTTLGTRNNDYIKVEDGDVLMTNNEAINNNAIQETSRNQQLNATVTAGATGESLNDSPDVIMSEEIQTTNLASDVQPDAKINQGDSEKGGHGKTGITESSPGDTTGFAEPATEPQATAADNKDGGNPTIIDLEKNEIAAQQEHAEFFISDAGLASDQLEIGMKEIYEAAKVKRKQQDKERETRKGQPVITIQESDDEEQEIPAEDEINPAKNLEETLSKSWSPRVTEHIFANDGRWEDACALFLIEDTEKAKMPDFKVKIPGIATTLKPYQLLGLFVLFEMENFHQGGYLADEMGLGKTLEALGVVSLNRVLSLNVCEVDQARREGNYTQHLEAGTPDKPQPHGASCPSGNPWGILCPCIDDGISNNLKPSFGPNLVLSPLGLLPNWLDEINKHLDMSDERIDWKIRYAHGDIKNGSKAPKLSQDDWELVKTIRKGNSRLIPQDGSRSGVIICSTSRSMYTHMTNVMATKTEGKIRKGGKRGPDHYEPWDIGFGRIIVDEVHTESNAISGTIKRVDDLDKLTKGNPPRKLFLTGTPFETTPANMAGWVSKLEAHWWTKYKDEYRVTYPRRHAACRNLRVCTSAAITELGKEHARLVREKLRLPHIEDDYEQARLDYMAAKKAHPQKESRSKGDQKSIKKLLEKAQAKLKLVNESRADISNRERMHQKKMKLVVSTIWVRRTPDSLFFGFDLTVPIPNYHMDVVLHYPEKYREMLDERFDNVNGQVQQTYQNRKKASKGVKEVTVNTSTWLAAARDVRIISSFPEINNCEDLQGMKLTRDELMKGGWMATKDKKLYELKNESPYSKNIAHIASPENCLKMEALEILRDKVWEIPDKKLVIGAMSPVSAHIIYWYIRKVWKRPVALVHSAQSASTRNAIVRKFQGVLEDSDKDRECPQYLVGCTTLINTGVTLTAANCVVAWDSEWLLLSENQLYARVNRITQQEPFTNSVKFVNGISKTDMSIHDRQGARKHMVELIEKEVPEVKEASMNQTRQVYEEDGNDDDMGEDGTAGFRPGVSTEVPYA